MLGCAFKDISRGMDTNVKISLSDDIISGFILFRIVTVSPVFVVMISVPKGLISAVFVEIY